MVMQMKTVKKKPSLTAEGHNRSFGRLASRMSVAAQKEVDERLAPFAVIPQKDEMLDVAALFAGHKGPLLVELGMGKGEQISARAVANPDNRYIGCEVYRNGLEKTLRVIEAENLTNLRLCPHDARDLLAALPDKSVDNLLILYPDPWPKKKHHKRRIVQAPLLSEIERVLAVGGELLLVTDIVDYALWMLSTVYAHGAFFPLAISPAEWAVAPHGWVPTGYEKKALREGRKPFYLRLRRATELEGQDHNLKTPAV
jgi:tRNA (guanine-N7-)-methyltransferase